MSALPIIETQKSQSVELFTPLPHKGTRSAFLGCPGAEPPGIQGVWGAQPPKKQGCVEGRSPPASRRPNFG